jgi:hypothetical protein
MERNSPVDRSWPMWIRRPALGLGTLYLLELPCLNGLLLDIRLGPLDMLLVLGELEELDGEFELLLLMLLIDPELMLLLELPELLELMGLFELLEPVELLELLEGDGELLDDELLGGELLLDELLELLDPVELLELLELLEGDGELLDDELLGGELLLDDDDELLLDELLELETTARPSRVGPNPPAPLSSDHTTTITVSLPSRFGVISVIGIGASLVSMKRCPPSFSNGFAGVEIVPAPVTANHFAQTLQVEASISTSNLPPGLAVTFTEFAAVIR